MPQPWNNSNSDTLYYSFAVGGVTFVMIDTETAIDTSNLSPAQVAWMQTTLAGAAASTWRVVGGHRPFYCTDSDKTQCGLFADWLRLLGEETLVAGKADLVLSAHEHGWERTYPLVNGSVVTQSYAAPGAPFYVVSGAAGNREGNEKPTGAAAWSAFQSGDVGFTALTITPSAIGVQFIASADGSVVDAVTLTK